MKNFKNIGKIISRNEMRSINAGSIEQDDNIGLIGGHPLVGCLTWPGCFQDCDCGVYNCNNPAWVHCATLFCKKPDGTTSTNKRCSC